MTVIRTLPSIETIPDDIKEQLRHLIHHAPERVSEEWLCELIKNSGHLTTPEYMRWRVISLIWLATQFSVEKAWPYLMWLNMNEPVMSDHLNEIVSDGVEEMQCHVQLANWIAQAEDERLVTFFRTYKNIPAPHKMGPLLKRLMTTPHTTATGIWLGQLCRDIADNPSPHMRPWRLLTATWYATCFEAEQGLAYLRQLSDGQATLSPEDNRLLSDTADKLQATPTLIQWIADCPNQVVKTMLKEFGHPDLDAFVDNIFQNPPDYEHLVASAEQAAADAHTFQQLRTLLEQANISPRNAKILDLACGPLAAQTLLLNSAGYTVVGADLHIPPDYLPVSLRQRFKKGKYVTAWRAATEAYYRTLAQQVDDLTLTWKKAKIALADVRRLHLSDERFDVVICVNHLQHAPDVNGLLAEAARVLKPGGLFLAIIKPYAGLNGDFHTADRPPWSHLREGTIDASLSLNRWREGQYRRSLERDFIIEQWLPEQDAAAEALLTPELRAELADYSPEELTRKQITIIARKNQGH